MNPITVALGFVPSFYSWQIGDFEFHRGEFYWPQLQLLTSQFTQAMGDGNELTFLSIIRFDYKNVRHQQRENCRNFSVRWFLWKNYVKSTELDITTFPCEMFSRNIFQVLLRFSFSSYFGENFVKETVLQRKLLNKWFDEIFFQYECEWRYNAELWRECSFTTFGENSSNQLLEVFFFISRKIVKWEIVSELM